ncbi:Sodium-dependent glucose transporter 1-like protein [Dinothrombium tinctorium]|uniref:Sodium-dependent glucose transporter 1-like protein n=1 Tax=Dinothrombium tinctorium TaxID=1965070 RepID=A0A3S3QFK3_9ACAR|nr:Sodium-dependent glucose transporter 1-like protein [Dinothrombium tinctorium]RWS08209.1 Sodium-dependent glucose transporter 1-like protein [Dinothrombium tinctorium]
MNSSLPGVTLLDLQLAVNCTLDEATLLMPTNAAGFMVGALICGVIIEFIDFQIVLLISTVACSATTAYFPLNRKFWILCLNSSVNGFLTGFMISGGNAWLLHLWGKASPPFLQAFHFCFGLGAFIGPLVAEPFLLPLHHEEIEIHVNSSHLNSSLHLNSSFPYTSDDLKIQYAYGSLSLASLIIAAAFLAAYCAQRTNKPHPSIDEMKSDCKQKPISAVKYYGSVMLCCFFMFFNYGLELSFGQLLTAFVVDSNLKLSKSKASFMTSVYWGAFTFFRCFTIFLVDKFTSTKLIIFNLSLIGIANVFLVPFGCRIEWCLWVGVTLVGFGTSPLFATIFSFLGEYMKITSKVSSLLFVACYAGAFVMPYVVGVTVETHPDVFLYQSALCAVSLCLVFFGLFFIKRAQLLDKCEEENNNVELRNKHIADAQP